MNKYENLKSVEKHKQKIDNNGWDYSKENQQLLFGLLTISVLLLYIVSTVNLEIN